MAFTVNMDGVAAKIDRICTNETLGIFAANTAADSMEPFVPRREGALSTGLSIEPFKVRYISPYARYQYYGEFENYTTPGTGSHWDERVPVRDIAKPIEGYIRTRM